VVEGAKVTIEYIATVPSSVGIDYGNVSEFIQGQHEIFPVVEREVAGMKPGEEKQVQMSPTESFGSRDNRKN
jgi:FKBP-type peptidyl-prolyl cis-trans isomerase 2